MLELLDVQGGYGDVTVAQGISLACPDSAVTAILGPNGAGKTTTLRLIMGLVKLTGGDIRFGGQSLREMPTHKRASMGICLIPEGRAIFPSLTVLDNLICQAVPGQERSGVERVVEAFPSLGSRLSQRAGSLSGGEQRMLGLARVYMRKPKLVLVDEPSLGLAPVILDRIFGFLSQMVAADTTLLIVEQYAERALALADRVYVLARGQVQAQGKPEDIRDSESLLGAYVTGDGSRPRVGS